MEGFSCFLITSKSYFAFKVLCIMHDRGTRTLVSDITGDLFGA